MKRLLSSSNFIYPQFLSTFCQKWLCNSKIFQQDLQDRTILEKFFGKERKKLLEGIIGGEIISLFPPTIRIFLVPRATLFHCQKTILATRANVPSRVYCATSTYIAASEFRVPLAEHEIACNCRLAFAIFTPFSRCTTAPCLPFPRHRFAKLENLWEIRMRGKGSPVFMHRVFEKGRDNKRKSRRCCVFVES